METKFRDELIAQALYRLDESNRMLKICLDRVSLKSLWIKPNSASNSIGNLVLHLCGNMTQYINASLGETEDVRDREREFMIQDGLTKEEVWKKWNETLQKSKYVLRGVTGAQLLKRREVQGFTLSGLGIVMHVLEHVSYHTGQIAFLTKQLNNEDLGFYKSIDLTIKNKD